MTTKTVSVNKIVDLGGEQVNRKTMGIALVVIGFGVGIWFTIINLFIIAITVAQGNPEPDYKLGLLIAMIVVPPVMYFGYKLKGDLDKVE